MSIAEVETVSAPGAGASRGPAAYGFAPSLIAALRPSGPQAEAIRTLRTHVVAQHISQGRRALAVCGPNAGVGCSFLAANLAISLSQIGLKTLLVDGDLRRPALDALIRPPHPPRGLIRCLTADDTPFSANIDADIMPNFSVLYAGEGAGAPNTENLVAGNRFRALMNFCLREYDATIVDTPPANTSPDSLRISAVIGYSLIVTARDRTAVHDVKVLAAQLKADGAQIIGSVLNRA
jgi:capsular exopolysaccharide synthesis family protein